MKFCNNCGQQLNDDATFCSKCGTATNSGAAQQPAQPVQPVQPVVMSGDADVQANKSIAWLAYLGPLLLIPMLARKTSEYCKFHVKQGATLFAASLAYAVVTEIIKAILRAVTEVRYFGIFVGYNGLYWTFYWIFSLGSIFFTVMAIIGIVNAATGKWNKLPVISLIPWIEPLMDKIYASMNK